MTLRKPYWVLLLLLLPLLLIQSNAVSTHQYAHSTATEASSATAAYVWPAPNSRYITSGFGNRNIALYGYERFHTGVDIHTAIGAPVLSIADGTVVVSVFDDGWGDYIMVNHGDGLVSLYAHLDSRSVKRGDTVTAGQQIGTSGNSGLSSGPHLHFELRQHGKSIQPFQYTYK